MKAIPELCHRSSYREGVPAPVPTSSSALVHLAAAADGAPWLEVGAGGAGILSRGIGDPVTLSAAAS
jgi:hypothetical protein